MQPLKNLFAHPNREPVIKIREQLLLLSQKATLHQYIAAWLLSAIGAGIGTKALAAAGLDHRLTPSFKTLIQELLLSVL